MDKIAPYKYITIPNHKIWKEPWITKGLSNSMNKCTQLYKKTLTKNASQQAYIINIKHTEIVLQNLSVMQRLVTM